MVGWGAALSNNSRSRRELGVRRRQASLSRHKGTDVVAGWCRAFRRQYRFGCYGLDWMFARRTGSECWRPRADRRSGARHGVRGVGAERQRDCSVLGPWAVEVSRIHAGCAAGQRKYKQSDGNARAKQDPQRERLQLPWRLELVVVQPISVECLVDYLLGRQQHLFAII